MKKSILAFTFIILLLSMITIVSATSDINQTHTTKITKNNDLQKTAPSMKTKKTSNKNINKITKKIVKTNDNEKDKKTNKKETISVDDEAKISDCCSTIIHASSNESAISFRRDSDGPTATIYIKNYENYTKQYKTYNSYFFHTIVTKDGWLVGNGGRDNAQINQYIEQESLSMIKNNYIASSSMNKIQNYERNLGIGHYVIKSPNGTYSLAMNFNGNYYQTSGKLNNGEYLVVPNNPRFYHKGDYKNYTKMTDVLNASRNLAARDPFGINRKQITTYYFKTNGIDSSINIQASNDNGKYVGRSTAYLCDNIQTDDRYINRNNIPVLDNAINVDTVNYQLRKANTTVKISSIKAKSTNITFKAIVKDELGNKVNDGKVIFYVNGKALKNSKNKVIEVKVKKGVATLNRNLDSLWNKTTQRYVAKYKGTDKYLPSKNNSTITANLVKIQVYKSKNITLGHIMTIKVKITNMKDKSLLNEGSAIIKFNNETLTKKNNKPVTFNIKKGIIKYKYKIPLNFTTGNNTLSIEFTKDKYTKVRNKKFTVNKIQPQIQLIESKVRNRSLIVTGRFLFDNSTKLKTPHILNLLINNKTVKKKKTINYNITEGMFNITYKLNKNYKKGNYNITLVVPEASDTIEVREDSYFTVV